MSTWDERYRDREIGASAPAAVLLEHQAILSPPGSALDLACGLGANALFLAGAGFQVHAWDSSSVAIARLRAYAGRERITLLPELRDVVAAPPLADSFDLILVSRFLERSLCPAIGAALRPGGMLFYQTFFGTGPGPSNPAFRLESGELPRLFAGLEILVYREESATGEAQMVARHPAQESRG